MIGKSVDPIASFEILTRLFEATQTRGEDASGFWGTQDCEDDKIAYHKEPTKSSFFIKEKIWKKIAKFNPNLMLLHCRAASQGSGPPHINRNNHPFVNSDKSIALVHNGRVPEAEYRILTDKYETFSNCDSEILLRIFENGNDRNEEILKHDKDFKIKKWESDIAYRVAGLRDIWSYMSYGYMSVAAGEYFLDGKRRLWLFRNRWRSLWISDLRETLGQVFFYSTPHLWYTAINNCRCVKKYIKNLKMSEIPPEEIWLFETSKETPVPVGPPRKFNVNLEKTLQSCKLNGNNFKLENKSPIAPLLTELDDNENVIRVGEKQTHVYYGGGMYDKSIINPGDYYKYDKSISNPGDYTNDDNDVFIEPFQDISDPRVSMQDLEDSCKKIKELIMNIEALGSNRIMEGSMSASDYSDLLNSLEQLTFDLEGTARMLDR